MDKGLEKIYILNRKLNFLDEQLNEKKIERFSKLLKKR